MKTQLQDTLERTAKILSGQTGKDIQLVCRGNESPRTDGRTIWLPQLPSPCPPEIERAFHGLIDHEGLGHVRLSNFSIIKAFMKNRPPSDFHVLNVVEDLWIENKTMSDFCGSKANLEAAHADCLKRWAKNIKNISLQGRILGCLLAKGKGSDTTLYGEDANEVVNLVADLIGKAPKLRSTKAAAQLASEILQRWKDHLPDQNPQNTDDDSEGEDDAKNPSQDENKEQGKGQDENISQEDEENGAGEGDKGPTKGSDDDSKSEVGQDQRKPSRADSGDSGKVSEDAVDDGKPELDPETRSNLKTFMESVDFADAPSLSDHLQNLIAQSCRGKGTIIPYRVFTREFDTEEIAQAGDPAEFQKLLESAKPFVSGLRQRLLSLLRSKSQSRWVSDENGTRLDRRKLHTLLLEIPSAPFASKTEAVKQDVAISILVDQSNSMGGPRMELAKQSCALLSETLAQLNLPFEIVGFTTSPMPDKMLDLLAKSGESPAELHEQFARIIPLRHVIYKSFRETYRSTRNRIATMENHDLTPLNESLIWAARRLLNFKQAKRRILIILTDGEVFVSNPTLQLTLQANLDLSIKQANEAGIETIAVGIQTESVRKHFPQSIVVNELGDLPKETYGILAKILLKNFSAQRAA